MYASNSPAKQAMPTDSSSDEPSYVGKYEIAQLEKTAKKIGLTPEVRELIEANAENQKLLQAKSIKLGILEAIAMESMDENVVELRNQLFTVITLLYSDKIDELLKENDEYSLFGDDSKIDFDDRAQTGLVTKEEYSKHSIISRMREYTNKRRMYKSQLKRLKKNLKNNAGL